MIQFPSFPHRKILLTALLLAMVSLTVLVAQNTPPPKEVAPAETGQNVNNDAASQPTLPRENGQVGTFEVKQVTFTKWNTATDTSGIYLERWEGGYEAVEDFQVLSDRVIYNNSEHGILVIDRKTGKTIDHFSGDPTDVIDQVRFDGNKYYVKTGNANLGIYSADFRLLNSYKFPYENYGGGYGIVHINNTTYINTGRSLNDKIVNAYTAITDDGQVSELRDGHVYENGDILVETDPLHPYVVTADGKKLDRGLLNIVKKGGGWIGSIANGRVYLLEYNEKYNKEFLVAYAFNDDGFSANPVARIEIPKPKTPSFWAVGGVGYRFSKDGTVYYLVAEEKGIRLLSFTEVPFSVPHAYLPGSEKN